MTKHREEFRDGGAGSGGHFRASRFQNFLAENSPRTPYKLASPRLLVSPPPPPQYKIRSAVPEDDNPNFFLYKTLPLSDLCVAFDGNTTKP